MVWVTEGGCTSESLLSQLPPGDNFKRVFTLFALAILLCPIIKPNYSVKHMWPVVDVESMETHNWVKFFASLALRGGEEVQDE